MAKKGDKVLKDSKMSSQDETKLFAFLGILLTVVGFLIAILVKRDDKYVMFYAKQGLVLFFLWVIVSVVNFILSFIPVLGGILGGLLIAFVAILWILGMVYSLSGKEQEIPIIGSYASMIRI